MRVETTDVQCDIFVTTVFQREGLSGSIGRECGVERHIRSSNAWASGMKMGASTPKAGDIITFNWDQIVSQIMVLDHIGIVESVSNGIIHTVEGTLETKSVAIPIGSDAADDCEFICCKRNDCQSHS